MTLALLLLAAARADAIVGGEAVSEGAADPIVLVYEQSQGSLCSGVVIAPRVVLTAAACIETGEGLSYVVTGGVAPFFEPLFTIQATEVHRSPLYDPQAERHDVGVVLVGEEFPVTPLPWLATDDGSYAAGRPIQIFGYGTTGPAATDSGTRRGGLTEIASGGAAGLFTSDAASGALPCGGDAGGPVIPPESITGDVVIGVVSFGDQDCASFGAYTRTDDNAAFIALYAPEASRESGVAAAIAALVSCRRRRASR